MLLIFVYIYVRHWIPYFSNTS